MGHIALSKSPAIPYPTTRAARSSSRSPRREVVMASLMLLVPSRTDDQQAETALEGPRHREDESDTVGPRRSPALAQDLGRHHDPPLPDDAEHHQRGDPQAHSQADGIDVAPPW